MVREERILGELVWLPIVHAYPHRCMHAWLWLYASWSVCGVGVYTGACTCQCSTGKPNPPSAAMTGMWKCVTFYWQSG